MKNIIWSNLSSNERSKVLCRPLISRSRKMKTRVSQILLQVKRKGEGAVLLATKRFDRVNLKTVEVSANEINRAYTNILPTSLKAIKTAARRIKKFHLRQKPKGFTINMSNGIVCERKYVPIDSVGLYVPGGTAPLPSTVMMLAIPADIAGCQKKVLATPPRADGSIDPHILVAADIVGIKQIFKMGGAQAIAAMAYGASPVPKVDKIFGPGNPWVTEAKLQVSQDVDGAACDLPAGPSEVLVIADENANAEFVSSDLLAQAEHGVDSQVVLISNSLALIQAVSQEINNQLPYLPRAQIAKAALLNSVLIYVENISEALTLSNQYAPEHLILHTRAPKKYLPYITNAGSVFLGEWSPESVGDYACGPNHVLPTYGFARSYGGLSVDNFMKSMTVQQLSKNGLMEIGPTVETLASLEYLEGHKQSVTRRLRALGIGV